MLEQIFEISRPQFAHMMLGFTLGLMIVGILGGHKSIVGMAAFTGVLWVVASLPDVLE